MNNYTEKLKVFVSEAFRRKRLSPDSHWAFKGEESFLNAVSMLRRGLNHRINNPFGEYKTPAPDWVAKDLETLSEISEEYLVEVEKEREENASKAHNERRIAEYRDIAIELLQQIQDQSQVDLYFQACNALSSLQSYLDLSADQYPVKESLAHQARNLWRTKQC